MSIAIIIPDTWEPAELVRWSSTLARSKDEHLLIIRARRLVNRQRRRKTLLDIATDDSPLMAAIREHAGDFAAADQNDPRFQRGARSRIRAADPVPRSIFLIELDHSELVAGVLRQIKALRVALLIVPRRQGVRISDEECAVERQLFDEVPCEVLQLRPGRKFTDTRDPILVATDARQKTTSALKLGAGMGAADDSQVTAVYVRQDGSSSLRNKRPAGPDQPVRKPSTAPSVPRTPETASAAGIAGPVRSYAAATGHDMLIVGAGDHLTEDRQIRACVPEKLMAEVNESTIVIVRGALPLRGRLIRSIEHRKKSLVPQLDRHGRIEVVRRMQASADWDFDFLILVFLATLLAAMGLVVNSPPVVIGAMLVAPLMSPMLGIGMSVVQGNRQMAQKCLGTVGRGFLLAFATGCAVGIIRVLFTSGLTEEMTKRGAPNVLDLAVAFVSGMVAAYAFGRPHLLSVLPGIAIASSLVPPVAASGMALIAMNLDVAVGAALLFLSNFVAIVLGSAFSLWVVGMHGPRVVNPFTEWAQRWMFGFFAVSVCLAVFFTFKGDGSQLRAALHALEDGVLPPPTTEVARIDPPVAQPQTTTPQSPAAPPAQPAQPPADAVVQNVRVANKPITPQAGPAPQAAKPQTAPQESKPQPVPQIAEPQANHEPAAQAAPQTEPADAQQAEVNATTPAAPPSTPPAEPPAQGTRVTVVIPNESPDEGTNTSVQIEGLRSEHVAELVGEVLSNEPAPKRSEPATLVLIALGLVGLGYLGWRYRISHS